MVIPLVPCILMTWTVTLVGKDTNLKGNIKDESKAINIAFIRQVEWVKGRLRS